MKNKTSVLITGCSSGIGQETAIYLNKQGYDVHSTARYQKDVLSLSKQGLKAYKLDVTKKETIKECLKQILKQTNGKIDVLFNNAGYGQMGAMEDISTNVLKKQFETNVFGLFEMTNEVLKIMLQAGHGKIIQHSSVLGLVSLKYRGAYNASKYAVEGLSDTLRLELKDTNIYISLLNTGPVTSSFRENAIKSLKKNVNIEASRFKDRYIKSINATKSDVPFNLEAIDVAKVVEKIIKTDKPNPRYYITKATYIFGFFKRVLSTSLLDKILAKV
ncbi:MAG: short-chain dehydrogenase [Epsilonproteobacteria bacterium]|nr:MAG: short-chain dehydrogenase [Campylobacterota bacterium]